MKVIVTGGAGFIGSHVVDRLVEAGHEVLVFDDFSSGRESNLEKSLQVAKNAGTRLTLFKEDIRDALAWEKAGRADALFHFAAQTSVTASFEDLDLDFDLNARGALNVCKWIKKVKPRFYLYANTAGALYGSTSQIPTSEDIPLWPECMYGATKSFGEVYLNAFVQSMKSSKAFSSDPESDNYFSWAALRLANVYGERQISKGEAGVLPIFAEKFVAGKAPIVFGEEAVTRDYVHVSDVASAFMRAFERMQETCLDTGFNIGTGVETSSEKVYSFVFAAMEGTPYFKAIEGFKEPKRLPLRAGEVFRSCLDSTKAKELLSWESQKVFSDSVKPFVDYFLKNEL
ncbi:NAD-dependent epimerase/dehydratase family protein [bacterium]|nr:NAD-dependent epimerase/dehydratase family protein [bacterium]